MPPVLIFILGFSISSIGFLGAAKPNILFVSIDDIPPAGKKQAQPRDYDTIIKAGKYKESLQAYLASITFAYAQIGRVLSTLKKSRFADSTIIVLWSDHGWHHGEKNHWHKWTLWEDATQIPFIIAGPPVQEPGTSTHAPVSALSLYPTLIDLCGLPRPAHAFDEQSLRPLLEIPTAVWKEAIIIQRKKGECAIRSKTHRYIHYPNGEEELYDLVSDPHEWHNIAGKPSSKPVISPLSLHLPQTWTKPIPSKSSFTFNPKTYTWTPKKP